MLSNRTLYTVLDADAFLAFHTGVELFAAFVAMATAYVAFAGFGRGGSTTILLLATSFLTQAVLDTIHALAYQGMPYLIIQPGPNESIYMWLSARVPGSLLLFFSAILPEKELRPATRTKILLVATTAVALFSILSVYAVRELAGILPPMFVPGKGLTDLKIALEYLVTIVLGGTALFYIRSYLNSSNRILLTFTIGVVLYVFSEVGFMLYMNVFDIYNVVGHILKLAAFSAFLFGLLLARRSSSG